MIEGLAQPHGHTVRAEEVRSVRLDELARGVTDPHRRRQALANLPLGTLGRGLYQHYRSHHFALPGEKGGLFRYAPESLDALRARWGVPALD